jgi:hypothetical protein
MLIEAKVCAPHSCYADRTMPLFYFHTRGGAVEAEDLEGLELADAAAARATALRGARSIIASAVLEGRLPLGERIEVTDEAGRLVLTLPFADAVAGPG